MTVRTPHVGTLGTARGTALYLGAILGPGVLALPGLAAAAAGPAALVAWIALLALSVPVAATFASLAARRPDAGGVATFTRAAFGDRAAAVCGWWFYSVIPVGAVSAANVAAAYIGDAAGLGTAATAACSAALVVAAFTANHIGLRLSGGAQLVLMGLLVLLMGAACAAALPHFDPANLRPFAPHGLPGILSAAAVLFFAFSGWEAASHLSGEFTDPARQLRRVTALTLGLIAVVYLGLATATAGVLGPAAATTTAPLTDLLAYGFGAAAAPLTAVCAAVLGLGAMNTFIAGASRLGAALARDGAMPAPLARGHEPGRIPHRSLALLAALTGAVLAAATAYDLDLDQLMRATSACLAAVTVLACAAAVRLLTGRSRAAALIATACTAAIALALTWYLLVPSAVAALALLYLRLRAAPPRPRAPDEAPSEVAA
ncbi:APC family permease [Glycomyces sp. TRM65418]|uniref:APC family permease n=1 Tax=Glycomyces sp. TRM65418 TaxID=2867006 RepID=UPI001D16EDA7|nr:APC family permease [Glycomyces sp. TRM65418]MCC3761568.1 APC family permease [Glycomyces sp. TRM65418]